MAAEARDNAARHYLECLPELQAREFSVEAKRAEVENALLELQRAHQECAHLMRLRQAEIRNNVVQLQSGLSYVVLTPATGGSAPGPVSPVQAAATMLHALPPYLTDSFRAWLATVPADQLGGTVIVEPGHCPQADDDASYRTMDGCCELQLDEDKEMMARQGGIETCAQHVTEPEAEGRRSRRPRSDPYPQFRLGL